VIDPKEPDLRKIKSTACVVAFLCCYAGHGVVGVAEEKRRRSQFRPAVFPADAPPVTVARCSTRRHCSSTVAAIPEVFLCNSWSFGGLFCKFKLFNVIFI